MRDLLFDHVYNPDTNEWTLECVGYEDDEPTPQPVATEIEEVF